MSLRGDYMDEMPGVPISDADVEALFTRREPSDAELLGLASALARIDLRHLAVDVEQRVGVFSLRAAALARQSGVSRGGSVPWWRRVRSKLVTSVLSVFAVIGMTGVAVASNAAAPGDLLYGIDQALEHIGINDGGITERLEEAATLAENGQPAEALDHAAAAVSSQSPSASDALERAALSLEDGAGITAEVAALLDWMSAADVSGVDFGQGVAERAQQLGSATVNPGRPGDVSEDEETSDGEDTQGQNPGQGGNGVAGNPGQANEGGQSGGGSDDPGSQGNAGNSENPGSQGNAGNGDNPGNQGDAGNGNGPPGGGPPGQSGR
jgi:hypothetical protein